MNAEPMHGSHAPGGSHRPADLDGELAAEGLDLQPQRDELDAPALLDPTQIEARSTLAQYLRPSAFPAGVAGLVAAAEAEGAPASAIALLERLAPRSYRTVNEVWLALGGASESRLQVEDADTPAAAADTAPPVRQEPDGAAGSCVEKAVQLVGSTASAAVKLAVGVPAAIVSHVGDLLRR